MKKIIRIISLIALSTSMYANIYARDINIGDPITMSISGATKEEITKAFDSSKLELDSVEKTDDGYKVVFRSFDVGESTITIGNKRITVDTKSVLTKDDKEIYPNLSDKSDEKLYNRRFPYEMIGAGAIALISLIYLLSGMKFKHKEKTISPEERYERAMKNLGDETWAFEASMAIREYIDWKLHTHFTSGIYKVAGPITQKDIDFLLFLDNYKFSGQNENIKDESITKVKAIHDKLRGEADELQI